MIKSFWRICFLSFRRFVPATRLPPSAPSCGHSTGPCGSASSSRSTSPPCSSPCMSGTARLAWRHADATEIGSSPSPQHSTCVTPFCSGGRSPSRRRSVGQAVCWWTCGPSSASSVCPPTRRTWRLWWSERRPTSSCRGYTTRRYHAMYKAFIQMQPDVFGCVRTLFKTVRLNNNIFLHLKAVN